MPNQILARLVLLLSVSLLIVIDFTVNGQELTTGACCTPRATGLGVGGWFHHEMICVSLRHWPAVNRALELDFCPPPAGGRLNLDWQRLEGSVGTEWCFPDVPQMALSLEVGASIRHYRYGREWRWSSETFIAGGVHFYFRTP